MTGTPHWFDIAVLVATAAGIALLWRQMARLDRSFRVVRRGFTCPATGEPVQVVAVQERGSGHYTGIRGCTAFARPENVRCSQGCVRALNLLAATETAPVPRRA